MQGSAGVAAPPRNVRRTFSRCSDPPRYDPEMRRSALAATFILGSGVLGSCVGSPPAQALYSGPPRGAAEVAELYGLIEHVDGQNVSGGKFGLLPGCHIVRPPSATGESSAQGASSTTLPEMHFSITMQAGHRYQIAIGSGHMDGTGMGAASIQAAETDSNGTLVRSFRPFAGPGTRAACEAEAKISAVLPVADR